MKRPLIGCVLLILGCSGVLMAQTVRDFTKIYDSYLAAVKSDDYRRVSSFLSTATLTGINTPEKQADFMKNMKQLRPLRYRTASLTISEDGQSAELQLSGRCDYWDEQTRPLTASEEAELRQNPPDTQGCYLPLRFVKDSGRWKLQGPLVLLGEGRC
jgi:hypothetical protein